MTDAITFFVQLAGYSYNPATETAEEGRLRCATDLATAEQWAESQGWYMQWADDWDIGSHRECYGDDSAYADREPNTCESACLFAEDGRILASLGCIDDADADYRRVIAAELASEALAPMVRHALTV